MGRRDRGLTLTEMLATLAVAGITLSYAVSTLNGGPATQRRVTVINDLVATLHLARSTAIARNQSVTVCPSRDGQQCGADSWDQGWIAFLDSGDGQSPPADAVLAAGAGDESLRIESKEFADFLTFRPTGDVLSLRRDHASGEFRICDRNAQTAGRLLTINVSGKPVLSEQRADGGTVDCSSS